MASLQFTAVPSDPLRTGFKVQVYAAGDHSTPLLVATVPSVTLDANGAGSIDLTLKVLLEGLAKGLRVGESVDVSISAYGPTGDSPAVFADDNPFNVPAALPAAPLTAHIVV